MADQGSFLSMLTLIGLCHFGLSSLGGAQADEREFLRVLIRDSMAKAASQTECGVAGRSGGG